MTRSCFFISDVHLRPLTAPGERAKQHQLLTFLRSLSDRAEQLYVVGDLFDFWFEYRDAVPRRGGRILAALADLVDAGVSVTCFGGNHDWWIASYLADECGVTVRHEPLWLETQGRRLYIAHGDGDSEPGGIYPMVRRLLHNPVAIAMFRLLHPDRGGALMELVARWSRGRVEGVEPEDQIVPVYETTAAQAFAAGADIAVFGHVHAARMEQLPGGTLVVLGDWIGLGTYGELADGVFSLRTWRTQGAEPWPQAVGRAAADPYLG